MALTTIKRSHYMRKLSLLTSDSWCVNINPFCQALLRAQFIIKPSAGKHVLHHLPQAVTLRKVVVNKVDKVVALTDPVNNLS